MAKFIPTLAGKIGLGTEAPVMIGQMSSVETGQMSAVETGQMSAAETGQISAVETRQMLKSQIGGLALHMRKWFEMGPECSPGLENPPR